MKYKDKTAISGVSLVEMGVVIVIIAFIVGAIVKGQDMLHRSKLDATIADLQKYKIAAHNFRTKYYYLPGDIPNPHNFMSAATCADDTDNTCAGNGDGRILRDGDEDLEEGLRAWQHLLLTEMITGNFTGERCSTYSIAPPGCSTSTSKIILGRHDGTDNIPVSKLEHDLGGVGGYWFTYSAEAPYSGNYLLLGRDPVSTLTDSALNGIISPNSAAAIDRKIDDGIALSGRIIGADSAASPDDCLASDDYDADNSVQSCVLWFSVD